MLHTDIFDPIWRCSNPHRYELVCPLTSKLLGWVVVEGAGSLGTWQGYIPGLNEPLEKNSSLSLAGAQNLVELFALVEVTTPEPELPESS